MNIRNWGLGDIMQLPDCCFGRRFIVACAISEAEAGTHYDISELAFPELCVIWEVHIWCGEVASGDGYLRLALGDQLPTVLPMVAALDPLLPGVGIQGPEPRAIRLTPTVNLSLRRLRMPLHSRGRRLVIELTGSMGDILSVNVLVVVSSIPNEVPDWLISGNLRSP